MRLSEIKRRIVRNPDKVPPSVPSQEYLYHGTPLNGLSMIVKSNSLVQGIHWSKPGEPHGVRCTRSLESAISFGIEQEIPGGILVLSWPKIAQRYKTIPYADTRHDGEPWGMDEAEEVILTYALKPLSEYLEGILMREEEYTQLKSGEYLKDEWLECLTEFGGYSPKSYRQGIQALMAYPNIRLI